MLSSTDSACGVVRRGDRQWLQFRSRAEHSSNIAALGYDAQSKTLQVNFKGGGRYQYQPVSAESWAALNEAESKGKYLNEEIKPNCDCHKLAEEE